MPKSSVRRSARRNPLADVSNGAKTAAATSRKEVHKRDADGVLRHRLAVARADLSRLAKQIDDHIGLALEQNLSNEKGRQEIDCFLRTLSDVHSSWKSLMARLQQMLGGPAIRGEEHVHTCSAADVVEGTTPGCPDEPDEEPAVSPSPLVSWRNGACTVESGRQLFLLTPLQKSRSMAARLSNPPKSILRGLPNEKQSSCSTPGLPLSSDPLLCSTRNILGEKTGAAPPPSPNNMSMTPRASDCVSDKGFISPLKSSSTKNKFSFYLTPRCRTPATKTCFVLDSIPESFQADGGAVRDPTPLVSTTENSKEPAVKGNSDSRDSSENSSGDGVSSKYLASKYPELFGLLQQPAISQKKEVDESLHWFLSPPKTCVLMESPDAKFLTARKDKTPLNLELRTLSLAVPEATPLWKNFESATGRGKNAGETTLKRELWTKFEAVSSSGLRFDPAIFQRLSTSRFTEMLEDAS